MLVTFNFSKSVIWIFKVITVKNPSKNLIILKISIPFTASVIGAITNLGLVVCVFCCLKNRKTNNKQNNQQKNLVVV